MKMRCGLFHHSMLHKTFHHYKCNWKYAHTVLFSNFPPNNRTLGTLKSDVSFSVLLPVHAVDSTQNFCKNFISNFSLHNNHYEILGLKQSASQEEIKSAFLELSKLHHPDKSHNPNKDYDINDFLQIRKAYEVLHNKKRRTEYDMKIFGRSSHVNRFSSGEYVLRENNSEVQHKQKSHEESDKQFGQQMDENDLSSSENGNEMSSGLVYLKTLLSKVYGAIFVVGLAIYLLGRRGRNHREINEIVK